MGIEVDFVIVSNSATSTLAQACECIVKMGKLRLREDQGLNRHHQDLRP